MRVLLLTPPIPLTADMARQVRQEIERLQARGIDPCTIVLAPEWTREVVEVEDVRLDPCSVEPLPEVRVRIRRADGTTQIVRGTVERMEGEPGPGELLGTFDEVPGAKPLPRPPGWGSDG